MELEYPHELIKLAGVWANLVLQSKSYRPDTKIYANILLDFVNQKNKKLKSDSTIFLKDKITKFSKFKIDYENTKKRITYYYGFENLIEYSILYTVLSQLEIKISREVWPHMLGEFNENNEFTSIISIISIINTKIKNSENSELASLFNEVITKLENEKAYQETKTLELLLYFSLGNKLIHKKKDFLNKHYILLRELMQTYDSLYLKSKELEGVGDEYLSGLFRNAIVLIACGYKKTLRIPYTESVNYIDTTINKDSIINSFSSAYDKAIKKLYYTPKFLERIPLMDLIFRYKLKGAIYGIISVILILLAISNIVPIATTWFLFAAAVLIAYTSYNQYKLKDEIKRNIKM